MFLDPDDNKSYIEKSGSAFRITQTIEALESSSAANKTIIVPKKDVRIIKQILLNKNLNGSIKIKSA